MDTYYGTDKKASKGVMSESTDLRGRAVRHRLARCGLPGLTLLVGLHALGVGDSLATTGDYYVPVGPAQFPVGTGANQMDDAPTDMAVLPSGEIIARDQTRIHLLNEDLVVLRSFPCARPAPPGVIFGEIESVRPVTVDSDGNIVAACDAQGVVKFSPSGTALGVVATPGDGPGQVRLVTDLAVATDGELVIADDVRWRILVFTQSGAFDREWTFGTRPTQGAEYQTRLRVLPDGPTRDLALQVRLGSGTGRIQFRGLAGQLLEELNDRTVGLAQPDGYGGSLNSSPLRYGYRAPAYSAGRFVSALDPTGANFGLRDIVVGLLGDLRGNGATNVLGVARSDGLPCAGVAPIVLATGDLIVCGERYRRVGRVLRPTIVRPPLVEIRRVAQRAGSTLVDIDYRIRSDVGGTVDAFLFALVDGASTPEAFRRLTLVEGSGANQGPSQPTNAVRRLVWDPAADLGVAQGIGTATIAAVARRGTSLMEFRFVTIPAGVPSSAFGTALEISATPVFDFELIPVWQFLVASGNPAVEIQGGNLVRASDGVILVAADGGITASGRSHLLATAGVRAATPVEADRARQGASVGEQYYGSTHSLVLSPVSMNEVGVDMQCPASTSRCAEARTSGVLVVPL